MSTTSDAEGDQPDVGDRLGTLGPGAQVLVGTGGLARRLERLPPAATENLLVITTGLNPGEIEAAIAARGDDPRQVGIVPVTATDVRYDGPCWTTDRVAPSDLTGISIRVSQGFNHLEADRGWVLLDAVSTLLIYADADRVYRLVDWLAGNSRQQGVRGLYGLEPDMVADDTVARFRALCDEYVDLR